MDQAFDALLALNERAVGNKISDLASDPVTGWETFLNLVPRILLRLLQSQRDTLFFFVDIEHHDFQVLPDFQKLTWMPQPAPGHIGDMQQAVHAVEVDECAEVGDVFHGARYAVAHIHAFHEFLALFTALLLDHLAPTEHDVFTIVIELNDFEIVGVANELLQIFRRNDVDLRRRQKRFDADVHHEAALDHRFHLAFDQAVTFENADDLIPVLTVGGFLLRENDHAFFVFQPLQEHVHFIANFKRIGFFKFGQRNDALGFVSHIDQHFARANFQDASLDDASLTEVWHRLRHHVLHLNHKSK